jgi:hypothetical protein
MWVAVRYRRSRYNLCCGHFGKNKGPGAERFRNFGAARFFAFSPGLTQPTQSLEEQPK